MLTPTKRDSTLQSMLSMQVRQQVKPHCKPTGRDMQTALKVCTPPRPIPLHPQSGVVCSKNTLVTHARQQVPSQYKSIPQKTSRQPSTCVASPLNPPRPFLPMEQHAAGTPSLWWHAAGASAPGQALHHSLPALQSGGTHAPRSGEPLRCCSCSTPALVDCTIENLRRTAPPTEVALSASFGSAWLCGSQSYALIVLCMCSLVHLEALLQSPCSLLPLRAPHSYVTKL